MAKNMKNKVLDVNDLHVSFDTYAGEVQAVRGVTFQLHEGEVLAIVGESGCGKSVTAQTIMKLNPMPPARIPQGEVHLGEHDIVKASEKEMQQLRGKEVSMIFQDPMTCLNPVSYTHLYVTVLPSLDSVPPLSRLPESRVVPAGAPPRYTICRRMSSGL